MIKKAIKNRILADDNRKAGVKVYSSEEILGSMAKVREFASFWMKNREDMEVIKASVLLDFCETMNFNADELRFFRLGLDGYSKFFENSEADAKSYLAEAEEMNSRPKSAG